MTDDKLSVHFGKINAISLGPHVNESFYKNVDVARIMDVVSGGDAGTRSSGGTRLSNDLSDDDDQLIGIVAGTVISFLALLAAIIVFCVVCRRRLRKYPADKPLACTVAAASTRLPINGRGATDVILTSSGGCKLSVNGSVPTTYGSHNSPGAAAMLLPPSGTDLYNDDDDQGVKVTSSSLSRDGSYRQPFDVLQTRQLPDLPTRIPVDAAGFMHKQLFTAFYCNRERIFTE